MRALEEGVLERTPDVIRHLDLCLGCRACETACPSGVRYGTLIEAARPFVERARPARARWARRGLAALLTRPRVVRAGFAPLRMLAGRTWLARLARRTRTRPLAYLAALPAGRRRALPRSLVPEGPERGTAVLLTGCVADAAFSGTNRATAVLLQRAGLRVVVPDSQRCCGALALHLGDDARARRLARAVVGEVAGIAADWIVPAAAGCGAMLRDYGEVLEGMPEAALVAGRARDPLELLAELGLPPAARGLRATVAVHDPCHLVHGQGVRDQVRRLLGGIPGVRLVELEESDVCCGSAGTYNLTEPAMAGRLLERKLDRIAASGADVIAAANPGCLLQIRAGVALRGLAVRVEHPIDLLAAAHGVSDHEAAVR